MSERVLRLRRVCSDRIAVVWVGVFVALALFLSAGCSEGGCTSSSPRPAASLEPAVRSLCSTCHLFPEPAVLPKSVWADVIPDMFAIAADRGIPTGPLSPTAVAQWFEERAPQHLQLRRERSGVDNARAAFTVRGLKPAKAPPMPGISHLRFADLAGDRRLELLATDVRQGFVMVADPYRPKASRLNLVARGLAAPVHVEVADLDTDGRRDLVVACLGDWLPADTLNGSVVWLRDPGKGAFEKQILVSGLGRVADVQPTDIDGDGDTDLVVAVFGWRKVGEVLLLENTAGPSAHPVFKRHILAARPGAVNVDCEDLNGDGRLDVVVLFAQEHEFVEGFVQKEGLAFSSKVLYRAPHPGWGMSGMQVTDLDGDGDLDVLVTNGDTLDDYVLKPYHGVLWLENTGGLRFTEHAIGKMFGIYRAEAGDVDGDGDLDVVAYAFLPHTGTEERAALEVPAVVLYERVGRFGFVPHVLERRSADHVTLAVGRVDRGERATVALGNFSWHGAQKQPIEAWVELWQLGERRIGN